MMEVVTGWMLGVWRRLGGWKLEKGGGKRLEAGGCQKVEGVGGWRVEGGWRRLLEVVGEGRKLEEDERKLEDG